MWLLKGNTQAEEVTMRKKKKCIPIRTIPGVATRSFASV